jgi:hypothetical protein
VNQEVSYAYNGQLVKKECMKVSEYFNLNKTQPFLDFVDVPLDTDLAVFLEPNAINSLDSPWGHELSSLLKSFFSTVLRLIKEGNHDKAQQLLSSLNESNEFHLGYSKGKSRGHGFGLGSAENVWGALTQTGAAVTGLLEDLEDTALLIEGIGTDMISDAISNILRGPLLKYTQDMCNYYGIPLTPDVASGPVWNPQDERWEEYLIPQPITDFGRVTLVPKILVRHRLTYDSGHYYRHYMLPVMQSEHIKAHSPLVEMLSNDRVRVTKKALYEKYGKSKLAVVEQTCLRPHILAQYKDEMSKSPTRPLSVEQFAEVEKSELPDLDTLVTKLQGLDTGRDCAGEYENLIEEIFSIIFYPSLCNPKREHKIHSGRKRVDITYTNEAKESFFYFLLMHYPCAFIFVECKNYGKKVSNPEMDQLAGRFSPSRGKVGLMVCRIIENKDTLMARCKDAVADDRGYMLALDDDDIITLIKDYQDNEGEPKLDLLHKLWNELVS